MHMVRVESKTEVLLKVISEERENVPSDYLKRLKTLKLYEEELRHLLHSMRNIRSVLLPQLEKLFKLQFKTPELLMLALTRPSIRNIFIHLEKHCENNGLNPINKVMFKKLAASGDAAKILALIGDSVLDLAVVQHLWDSSLTKVGDLTKRRSNLVSNDNLAKKVRRMESL